MLKKAALILITLSLLILSACQPKQEMVNGDIHETTKGINEIPTFLTRADKETRDLYEKVYEYKEIMQQIPPLDQSAYKSAYETFFVKEYEDGSLVWNNHALRSGQLLAIGRDATAMAKDGKGIDKIKKYIEEKYSGEYGSDDPRRQYKSEER